MPFATASDLSKGKGSHKMLKVDLRDEKV